jgi:hypothetical protein
MAKKIFTLRDFSGGINSVQDPRDINVNQFAWLKDFYVDQNGALRPAGSLINHNGLVTQKSINSISCGIAESGGRNLAYSEVDHDVGSGTGITNGTVKFYTGGHSQFGDNPVSPIPPATE